MLALMMQSADASDSKCSCSRSKEVYNESMQATVPQELDQQMHAHAGNLRSRSWQQNYGIMSGSYPATVQAVVLKIQAVVLKPSKIMFTCSWA